MRISLFISVALVLNLNISANIYHTDAANLMSGKLIRAKSKLYYLNKDKVYIKYKKSIAQSWSNYKSANFANMRAWREKTYPRLDGGRVFYPFGGPDLLNAMAFFPEADTYILAGLERVGAIPRPEQYGRLATLRGLYRLRETLNQVLVHNFFHTKIMKKNIGANSLTGLTSLLMLFASLAGNEIVDVNYVSLTNDGMAKHEISRQNAIEIICKSKSSKQKKIYYFQGDISDEGLSKKPGFVNFIKRQGALTTMLKAASYLMYRSSFDDIRSIILSRSKYILQDASGFPYHFLRKNSNFDLKLYGVYVKPIPLFRERCQPDLKLDVGKHSKGKLPFKYGYIMSYGHTVIMVAKRKGELVDLRLDKSKFYGVNTYCVDGRLVVDSKKQPLKK